MTPEERATVAVWMEAMAEVGGSPVVSHAGGTHWHIVFGGQVDEERLASLPWCRREVRRRKRSREGAGSGYHDQWREAGLVQISELPICSPCRRYLAHLMEIGEVLR